MRSRINFWCIILALTYLHTFTMTKATNESLAVFFEGLAREGDLGDVLGMRLIPDCSDLPNVKTHPPGMRSWREAVSDVVPPNGKCVRLFGEPNCCGKFLDVSESSHNILALLDWNDKVVSFREVPCNSPPMRHPSDCNSTEKYSYLAVFYENLRYKSDRHSVALEVSISCQNFPTLVQGNVTVPFRIFDIYIPEGKCMTLYADPDCEGYPFSYEYNGWSLREAFGRNQMVSFHETYCEVLFTKLPLPCPTDVTANATEGYRSFSATFYEDYRNNSLQIEVYSTVSCANVPAAVATPGNAPWNEVISDVTIPERECICLFDQPNCSGSSFHVVNNYNEYNVAYNFNDKTKSYRSCFDDNHAEEWGRQS